MSKHLANGPKFGILSEISPVMEEARGTTWHAWIRMGEGMSAMTLWVARARQTGLEAVAALVFVGADVLAVAGALRMRLDRTPEEPVTVGA